VTIGQRCWVWLTIDDRTWAAFPTAQGAADEITKAIGPAGTFKDTGVNLGVYESTSVTNRPMSVFQAKLNAGTYVFGRNDSGNNFYTIGASLNAIPEPMTLSLLALGGLLVSRKR
jgi:hypothetical protein